VERKSPLLGGRTEQNATPTTVGELPKWQAARPNCQNGRGKFHHYFFCLTFKEWPVEYR
jgi:hypothetical protein